MSDVPKPPLGRLFPFEPLFVRLEEKAVMQDTRQMELRRLPGLFRRWELAQVLEPGVDYHVEDAGKTECGTPLLAVYLSLPRDADE